MAQNVFRFTLDNPIAGSKQISEPDGWAKIKIILERDKEYHSVIEMIETPFIFYGSNGLHDGGMSYLDQFKLNDQVTITIEISQDNSVTWETMFVGLIDIQSKQRIDSRKVQYVITRGSLWTKFKARIDSAVNIKSTTDLDGNSVTPLQDIQLKLTSQSIRKIYSGYLSHNYTTKNFSGGGTGNKPYHIIEYDVEILNEITQMYTYPLQESQEIPFGKFTLDYAGTYRIQSQITFFKPIGSGIPTGSTIPYIKVYLQLNGDPVVEFTATDRTAVGGGTVQSGVTWSFNELVTDYTIDMSLILNKSDTIRIYAEMYETSSHISNFEMMTRGGRPNIPEFDFEGYWDPTSGLFPTSAPITGFMGGRTWILSSDGILQGVPVLKGWTIYALNNTPGQSLANWYVGQYGYNENTYAGLGDVKLIVTGSDNFPITYANGFFLHDVGGAILDRIIGITDKFYSEYLGSTQTFYRSYDNDGCGFPFALLRGLQLRQYSLSEKPFSISFTDWWKGVNPIHNLGIGYEIIDGEEVIEVEDKQSFYNETPILYLNWVNNIVESYDKDFIFNKIKIGYKDWKSEDISGIDDPQTNHEYSTIFETAGQPIDITSDFIAASLAIETTRRTTKTQSVDYKFDDNTFIIALNPDTISSPSGDYVPELDENFNSITNLLNPETRYNSILTPARNLVRWGNLLFGCLQDYLTSVIKFNKGEGNYKMIGDYSGSAPGICFNIISDALSEKQDISLASYGAGIGHLFQPIILEFKYQLSYTDYKLIRDNRKNAIAVSESDSDHSICFIKRMEYDVINSLASFTVWKK